MSSETWTPSSFTGKIGYWIYTSTRRSILARCPFRREFGWSRPGSFANNTARRFASRHLPYDTRQRIYSRRSTRGEESLAAIKRPFTEDEERQSVEPAIKEFEARAKDPPEVRALYAATEKQIHEFVFYWRYRMMMIALVVAVAGAIVLLVGTLLFARAKKRRTAVIT